MTGMVTLIPWAFFIAGILAIGYAVSLVQK